MRQQSSFSFLTLPCSRATPNRMALSRSHDNPNGFSSILFQEANEIARQQRHLAYPPLDDSGTEQLRLSQIQVCTSSAPILGHQIFEASY